MPWAPAVPKPEQGPGKRDKNGNSAHWHRRRRRRGGAADADFKKLIRAWPPSSEG
jgi:hypothetical protein